MSELEWVTLCRVAFRYVDLVSSYSGGMLQDTIYIINANRLMLGGSCT